MKKLLIIILCLSALIYMTACFDEQPGTPVASGASGGKWSGDNGVAKPNEIDSDAAYEFNNQLAQSINSRADGQPVSPDDLATVRSALTYMGQFNLFVHEESQYIEQLNVLYRSVYDLYSGNCTADDTHEAVAALTAAYDALSAGCRERMTRFDPDRLNAFVDGVSDLAAVYMRGSSSASSN